MYFLYVDESGDVGLTKSPTNHFCLSGFAIHEWYRHKTLAKIIDFRKLMKEKYGLKLREELHAATYIHKPGSLQRIPKSLRLKILKDAIDFQKGLKEISIINVVVNKENQPKDADIFSIAWTKLMYKFDDMLSNKKLPNSQNLVDQGMLIVDKTDEVKLRTMMRSMYRSNRTGQVAASMLVEDAVHRNSHNSYFIQLADVNAYFLYQKYEPCAYIKKKGGKNHFDQLTSPTCNIYMI